ncbi:Hypothetical predicted protein, partial [Marmota monax]
VPPVGREGCQQGRLEAPVSRGSGFEEREESGFGIPGKATHPWEEGSSWWLKEPQGTEKEEREE